MWRLSAHHDKKKGMPEGTAIKTAELMAEVRESIQQGAPDEEELIVGARGADFDGMGFNLVRLARLGDPSGTVFGKSGRRIDARHDS